MSRWTPCKRRDFSHRLRKLGFDGPFLVHVISLWFMSSIVWAEYSVPQLRMMLREVEEIIGRKITVDEWNRLA